MTTAGFRGAFAVLAFVAFACLDAVPTIEPLRAFTDAFVVAMAVDATSVAGTVGADTDAIAGPRQPDRSSTPAATRRHPPPPAATPHLE